MALAACLMEHSCLRGSFWLLKLLRVARRNKHSCGCPVLWQARPLPWRAEHPSAWGVQTPCYIPATCRLLYLLSGHMLPTWSQRLWPKRLNALWILSFCRCYWCLFVFRRPLFSSDASVSCFCTGGVTCLCVRLFPAVGQLNLLGHSGPCAPAKPPEGSYCLWCSGSRSDGELGVTDKTFLHLGNVFSNVITLNGVKEGKPICSCSSYRSDSLDSFWWIVSLPFYPQ